MNQALIDRFNTALESYGIPAGSGRAVTNDNPLTNLFARLDFNLSSNTSLVLRHNFAHAEDNIFSRTTSTFNLDNNGYAFKSNSNSTAAQLRTNFSNGMFNEVLVSVNSIRDRRKPNVAFPQVEVNTPVSLLVGGGERSSHANELDQDVIELSDNFSIPLGASHRLTLGHAEPVLQGPQSLPAAGLWSLDLRDDRLARGGEPAFLRGRRPGVG